MTHHKIWIRFSLFILVSGIQVSSQLLKIGNIKTIPPGHVGLYHTDSLERLGDDISSKQYSSLMGHGLKASSVHDLLLDILSSYCKGSSPECLNEAKRGMLDVKDQFSRYKRVNELPFGDNKHDPQVLHSSLKGYMEAIEYSLDIFDMQDVEDLVESIKSIELELKESRDLQEEEKYAGLAAASVAMESAKLWFSVLENQKHPLRRLYTGDVSETKAYTKEMFEEGRFLQEVNVNIELNFNLFEVIYVDFISTLASFGNPFIAIPASLFAFLYSIDPNNPPIFNIVITPSPTKDPTKAPSIKPTVTPSLNPTTSNQPSLSPSISSKPSTYPTSSPSSEPSISHMPSLNPSTIPSRKPSLNPSTVPSGKPSLLPSVNPSILPSSYPSILPSISSIPSLNPSTYPSILPSLMPSSSPSSIPSLIPTSNPTIIPSQPPSSIPTITMIPSIIPSFMPSKNPSTIPSINPSASNIPSKNPSTIPSAGPTP